MMLMSISVLVLLTSALVVGQRPFFAGSRPIGFPETPNRTTTTPDPLGNRFGDDRLPIEANGDRDLVDRLSKLPLDKQPFWFINWQALEEHRKKPQTYPQRPNVFVDPIVPATNSGTVSSRLQTLNRVQNTTSPLNAGTIDSRFEIVNPVFNITSEYNAGTIDSRFETVNPVLNITSEFDAGTIDNRFQTVHSFLNITSEFNSRTTDS